MRLATALEPSGARVRRRVIACRTEAPFPLASGVEAVHLYDLADRIAVPSLRGVRGAR